MGCVRFVLLLSWAYTHRLYITISSASWFLFQWPPPPRLTPIIVAPHLTSIKADQDTASSSAPSADVGVRSSVKAKQAKTKSSLHRAVMEKLEIQRAIGDLAGGSGG